MQLPTPITLVASGEVINIKLLIDIGDVHQFHFRKLALSCQECQSHISLFSFTQKKRGITAEAS